MQLAFRGHHASMITRGLRVGGGSLPLRRTSQFRTPGFAVAGGLRRVHVLPGCQIWSQDMRAGILQTREGTLGTGKRYIRSSDTKPHRQGITGVREYGSYETNRPEDIEEKGTKKVRLETWPRDTFGQSAQKGKVLTTPSRLLKLLIPLPTDHPKDVESIAILIHSQQPLSYLERLIQAELPSIKDENGVQRQPGVSFIAHQFENHPIRRRKDQSKESVDSSKNMEAEEVAVADGKGRGHPEETQPPGKEPDSHNSLQKAQANEDEGQRYVRWSHATEIGDFIRDAARAEQFIVAIEGAPLGLNEITITVPSFEERTQYLRLRLRKISDQIRKIAEIKHECDKLAHRGAQRVALGGFGVLVSWWCLVYKLTFDTDLGWDTMEPITYLASLSTLMGGYLWFLYHNREISYRSALDFTINARQKKLYQLKGVDLQLWENLIYEGNSLRREIKAISADYDTEWDERLDERDERVVEALKHDRDQNKRKDEQSDDDKEGKED